ncbi:MAG: hypothetical protein BRC28_00885 [Nanohaloarchaea archaeon SW_4_43_9]|nr:MAG: hypothetical protein BRC28_00885 [Nanohaloarchaea archaeon SW_4_43_9]
MELNRKTGKLLVLFLTLNLVSAVAGLLAVYYIGVLPGLAVFSVLIILLPLLIQYLYLSNESS